MDHDRSLAQVSAASAALLTLLCAITYFSGTSQQWFEWMHPPGLYGAELLRHATYLRVIIALDDVFIPAYTTMGLLFAARLFRAQRSPLFVVAMVFTVIAATLDFEENHHILAMLRMREAGLDVPLDAIARRASMSQLKWMLGHAAFALIGVAYTPRSTLAQLFRSSLVFVQLPVGALNWVLPPGPALTTLIWMRYLLLIVGFAMVAQLNVGSRASRGADGAVGSGAPA